MSRLIDTLNRETCKCFNGKWYIAKPIGKDSLKSRIRDSFKILTGKAIAIHFREDEK